MGGGDQVGGETVEGAEVVGGTGGDVPHGHILPALLEARDHLSEGAVAAQAYHPVVVGPAEGGVPLGVAGALGEVGGHQVSGLHEFLDHLREDLLIELAPGHRVHDEQELFAVLFQKNLLLHITSLP